MPPKPKQLTLFPMEDTPIKIRDVKERPAGYRILGNVVNETPRAVQVTYYKWILWIPKKAVRRIRETKALAAPLWAIESAKEHPSAQQVG